ncbi:hypothetical protein NVS55_07975 [Myxococcus stipitatus]
MAYPFTEAGEDWMCSFDATAQPGLIRWMLYIRLPLPVQFTQAPPPLSE